MSKEYIYDVWAPVDSPWSNWVKPVLFACMDERVSATPSLDLPELPHWLPHAESTALILDLPGAQGVTMGLVAASMGYRPVPLYNAVPWPTGGAFFSQGNGISVVDVEPIIRALWRGTEVLLRQQPSATAPPVFLLDANRRMGQMAPTPGRFDNRSVSFVTDFPSANFLLAQGIREVLLVQATGYQPQSDLAHTLLRWQEAGIIISLKQLDDDRPPALLIVEKPSWFGMFWQRVLAAMGLRRNVLGGFGGMVPVPGSG